MGIKQVLIIKRMLWTDEWVYVCVNYQQEFVLLPAHHQHSQG